MNRKLVSVIIPTFDRPISLSRAINSVINNSYKEVEIIIVDDNNPGTLGRIETEKVMSDYKQDPRIKYVQHLVNKNGSAARNTGFKNSSGEFIMFLDDDDEFLPGKIEAQVNCLETKDDSWGACYTKYKRIRDGKLDTICAEKKEGYLYFDELCRNLFIQAGSNLMIRRKAFEEIGGFDESFNRNQDIEMAVRLFKKYKIAYVDTMGLIYYRQSSKEKRSFDLEKITEHYLQKFNSHIEELSLEEKQIFYEHINLQLIRYRLISKKDFKSSLKMIVNKEVHIANVIKYFLHLLDRRVFKKSMGFTIRR